MVAMMAMVNDGNGAKDSQGWWLVGSVGFTRIGLAGLAVWLPGLTGIGLGQESLAGWLLAGRRRRQGYSHGAMVYRLCEIL